MQKVLDFLERYVEWVAVAIGGIFMLAMVFLYLLGTPISETVGDKTVTVANVETHIYDDAGRRLETAMSHKEAPSATVERFASTFESHMRMAEAKPSQPTTQAWVLGGAPKSSLATEGSKQTQIATNPAVVPHPLPAPSYYGVSSGKSNVMTEPGSVAPAGASSGTASPTYGGAPEMGPDGMPIGAPRAALPGGRTGATGAGGATAAADVPAGKDKVWVTQAYSISAEDLARAFDEAKVPKAAMTIFLRVDVVRQEQLADGNWGNDTSIAPLPYHQVPEFPKANPVDERYYADWASKNALTLLAPSFYPKAAGDTWYAPGQSNPNKPSEARPTAPTPPAGTPRTGRTRRSMQPGMEGMPGAPTGRRGRNYAPSDSDRPTLPFQQYLTPEQAEAQRQMQEAMEMGGNVPGAYGPGAQPGVGVAQATVPDGYKVPTGSFSPSQLDSDIFMWFHDDSVTPGRTYRYKVRYRVRNPVYGMGNVAPDVAKVFAAESEYSQWSPPVTVDPITRFFVASGVSSGSTNVRVEVFHWQDGKWQNKMFTVAPGDMIGAADGRVNYQTGWTLADLNASPLVREPVIVADESGRLSSRSYQQDQGSAASFKRSIDYKDPSAAPRTATGAPGTAVPGGPEDYGGYGPPEGAYGAPEGYGARRR